MPGSPTFRETAYVALQHHEIKRLLSTYVHRNHASPHGHRRGASRVR